MDKVLITGNHAVGESAIRAGVKCYFGYPITPQNELPEYMSEHLTRVKGGVFIQAESEIAAISMVQGAAVTGARVLTSSSGPGISLKQEGISFLAGHELPAVIVNMVRGGPGLGNIATAQSDYFQSTKGGGHGDYRTIVLAPASVQELADLTYEAFDLADKYRNPVIIMGGGLLGQMMEPVVFKKRRERLPAKKWALTGCSGRKSRFSRSLILDTDLMEEHNWRLYRKYQLIERDEIRCDMFMMEDAKLALISYGIAARIAKGAIRRARDEGLKVGMIRPVTLWPFPYNLIKETLKKTKDFIVFELSTGQMVEDVKLALEGQGNLHFYGRPGGSIPTPVELTRVIARQYYQLRSKE